MRVCRYKLYSCSENSEIIVIDIHSVHVVAFSFLSVTRASVHLIARRSIENQKHHQDIEVLYFVMFRHIRPFRSKFSIPNRRLGPAKKSEPGFIVIGTLHYFCLVQQFFFMLIIF